MSQFDNFVTQIESLPDLVREQNPLINDRMRLLLTMPEIYGIRQIILTGSGDSYFAAQAVAPAMRAWTGLPVDAMVAMEASRYIDAGRAPLAGRNRGLLVVSISSSGEPARVVEATQRLRNLGALTLALTANPQSRLGLAAERILDVAIPPSTNAPGTRSYVATLLAAYAVAIRIAEVLMTLTMDEANALRKEVTELADAVGAASEASMQPIARLAEEWKSYVSADVLGSGPALATAGYAAAKLVEAAGVHASAQDSEEFHHLNYFVAAPETVPAIVFAPSRAVSAARSRELVETLAGLGRPTLTITDSADIGAHGTTVVLPATREWFAPIVQTVPAAFIAAAWAQQNDAIHYRGHSGRWQHAAGAGLIRNSPIDLAK